MGRSRLLITVLIVALIAFVGGQAYGSMYGFFSGYPVVRIQVDGKEVRGDVPGVLLSNRVMVPIRFVSEALGAEVDWDQGTLSVIITSIPATPALPEDPAPAPGVLGVGMLQAATASGDDPFEMAAWAGITRAVVDFDVSAHRASMTDTDSGDDLEAVDSLIAAGSQLIVAPGYVFGLSVYEAQVRPRSPHFLILDGYPHSGDWVPRLGARTVSIFFAEQEAGFMAGFATAVELQQGNVGFIGGMELPAVQRFNWGFQQGVAYANLKYGTAVQIRPNDVVYQGTFHDVDAGELLATNMYGRGVKAIFVAAGQLGRGVIGAAVQQVAAGNPVWMIGVDVDQFSEGAYGDEGKSVVLTSAVKKLDVAVYDMVEALLADRYPGGQTLQYTVVDGGVGIPEINPNLSEGTLAKVAVVTADLVAGAITVSSERGNLLP